MGNYEALDLDDDNDFEIKGARVVYLLFTCKEMHYTYLKIPY